ncbi:MAG: hypothetical protein IT214_11460 [Chitinophagaceae bacterium]|nr:hypothetical protein [Chitinophagaceae bacterium]
MKKFIFFPLSLLLLSTAISGQVRIKKDNNRDIQKKETKKTVQPPVMIEEPLLISPTLKKTYDFSNVKICIDKSNNYDPGPRLSKAYPEIPKLNSNGQLEPQVIRQKLTAETNKMWPNESEITVAFAPNQTTNFVIEKVKQYAREWEKVANISFSFITDWKNAHVKVSFIKGGSWSWMGREVLNNPTEQTTMNFGWFDDNTPDNEFSRVVIHEFGHALGFIHEHQAAGARINWDLEKVYAYFAKINWSRDDVDRNIFNKYSQNSTNGSSYDKASIMHYFFPEGLTTDKSAFSNNTELSPLDKLYARVLYPFPPKPPPVTGVLNTGDDCDAIKFIVEYNVIPGNFIEFSLEPGVDNSGKVVTWWKQIGIPLLGGAENRDMQLLADGKTTKVTISRNIIDETRGMSFAKAKFLGVHTGLGFTWKVWEALPGGCRVRFIWQNDHCY